MKEYLVSIVMAVYNSEPFLKETLDSVIRQDIGIENIQMILVDDGSSDKSGSICDEYAQRYPENILVIHKPNGGVASARNEGLKYATGKYLNFLDSDDKFQEDSLRKCCEFFDAHEAETDIITMPLYFFDAVSGSHWQNDKFEQGSRVIDLREEPQNALMFVNASLFHNRVKEKIHFDGTLPCGEDIKMIYTILMDKPKLGVVADAAYMYRRRSVGEASLIQTAQNKKGWYFEYFENLLNWLMDSYQKNWGKVPGFIQTLFACEMQWRMMDSDGNNSNNLVERGILTEEEKKRYFRNIYDALQRIDDRYLVMGARFLYYEQRVNQMMFKHHSDLHFSQEPLSGNVYIETPENVLIGSVGQGSTKIVFIQVINGKLIIEGRQNLPCLENIKWTLQATDGEENYTAEWGKQTVERKIMDHVFMRIKTFKIVLPLKDEQKIQFRILVNEYTAPLKNISYEQFCPLTNKIPYSYWNEAGYHFELENHGQIISVRKGITGAWCDECRTIWSFLTSHQDNQEKAAFTRAILPVLKLLKRKPIWLISDRILKADDNGEAFFRYLQDNHKKEINSYFVISKNSPDYRRMKKIGRVVNDQSFRHKLLFLLADLNISSQANEVTENPFWGHHEPYMGLQKPRFIFLQHGITKDDLSNWLNRYNKDLEGFVVAAKPEYKSIVNGAYNYPENVIWLTGLPRYDALYNDTKRIITIIPTWRAYLLGIPDKKTEIRPLRPGFEHSEYFSFYSKLFSNKRLLLTAQKYGYRLQFVPHPHFRVYAERFISNDEVSVVPKETSYRDIFSESALLVTDYSSVAFDFSYLKKPVLYTQFDKETFFSGRHTYTKGYFDYERDGFGEVEYDLDSTVDRIIEYMANDCQLKEKYRKRIDDFFAFHDKNNCQRVYEKIMENAANSERKRKA